MSFYNMSKNEVSKFYNIIHKVEIESRKKSANSKIHYIVNEEKMTVVAYMKDCSVDAIMGISSNIFGRNGRGFLASIISSGIQLAERENNMQFLNSLVMKEVYRGKAICSTRDTFDVEKGKEIARSKMLTQYWFDYEKIVVAFLSKIRDKVDNLQELFRYVYSKFNENERLGYPLIN